MATVYPKFPRGDFAHIDKNLGVVAYYLESKKQHDLMVVAKQQHEALLDRVSKSRPAMYKAIRDRLKELVTPQKGFEYTKPGDALEAASDRMRGISGSADMKRKAIRDILSPLLPLFFKFDEEAMDKAAAAILEEDKEMGKELTKLSGTRGAVTGRFNTAVKNYVGVFSDPNFVRGATEQDKGVFAFEAACRFVDVWRQRARMFLTPVTIEGTAINTLPPESRKVWLDAYNKLGFSDLKRSDMLIPFKHEYSYTPKKEVVTNG